MQELLRCALMKARKYRFRAFEEEEEELERKESAEMETLREIQRENGQTNHLKDPHWGSGPNAADARATDEGSPPCKNDFV